MVKPGKLLPPDPRPWTAEPEKRKIRKEMEKENPGFDWGQAFALGLIGATVVFGIDKSLRKCEERHEEEEERREDRRREWESRSRPRRSSQSMAGSARGSAWGSARGSSARGSSVRERGYDRDYEDDREYWDRYYDEREAMRAARDYDREPARTPESMRAPPPKDEREHAREIEQFDRDFGYGRRYDEHRRSRSNPASRSRGGSNW